MTKTVLHIETSPLGKNSVGRDLGRTLADALKAKNPSLVIVDRDLSANPLPHLDSEILGAFFTPEDQRTAAQKPLVQRSDDAIAEVMAADTLIIEVPMWNFGIPSGLKAWVDHISRAGKTFQYTATGPVGLVPAGKKVILISSRGGIYSTGPAQAMDHQESYMKTVLGFLGITDVTVIRAEGMNMGAETAEKSKSAALEQIQSLVAAA